MPTVLSTKKLKRNQKELLLNSGIGLVEYDAIITSFTEFTIKDKKVDNAIITSQKALKSLEKKGVKILNCFCVGNKTAELCREKGINVLESANNSTSLAELIITNHRGKDFIYCCGNIRMDELPNLLRNNNIGLTEIEVYKTELNLKAFKGDFDGILFFSPSAVKSFTGKNQLNSIAFCIGETTASEAKKHTNMIRVANRPGIENVIAKVVAEFT